MKTEKTMWNELHEIQEIMLLSKEPMELEITVGSDGRVWAQLVQKKGHNAVEWTKSDASDAMTENFEAAIVELANKLQVGERVARRKVG